MSTQKHLQKIKSKCEQLLAIAEKRTQGPWKSEASRAYCEDDTITFNVDGPPSDYMYLQEEADAQFIAACAGPAEAGWRATIAAIDLLDDLPTAVSWERRADAIIAAWPEELL